MRNDFCNAHLLNQLEKRKLKTYKMIRFIKLRFSGASKVALTWDVNTKRRLIHVKCDSDVFAQEFSRSVSNYIETGRSLGIDSRSLSQQDKDENVFVLNRRKCKDVLHSFHNSIRPSDSLCTFLYLMLHVAKFLARVSVLLKIFL